MKNIIKWIMAAAMGLVAITIGYFFYEYLFIAGTIYEGKVKR